MSSKSEYAAMTTEDLLAQVRYLEAQFPDDEDIAIIREILDGRTTPPAAPKAKETTVTPPASTQDDESKEDDDVFGGYKHPWDND